MFQPGFAALLDSRTTVLPLILAVYTHRTSARSKALHITNDLTAIVIMPRMPISPAVSFFSDRVCKVTRGGFQSTKSHR